MTELTIPLQQCCFALKDAGQVLSTGLGTQLSTQQT